METYSVQAVLSLKDGGYVKGMKQAIDASEELERHTGQLSSGMEKFAAASAAGNLAARAIAKGFEMITSAIGGAVNRLDTMHNYPRVLESLGYSAADAQKSMETLSAGIEALPTTLDGIISSAQTLTASLGDLEAGTKTAVALNDMFLAGGQGAEAASRALVQYNQILAKGKVDMQSWNSMVEVAPGQLAQLAQSLLGAGASQRDLYAALQDGTLSVQDMNNAVIQLDQQGGEGFSSFHDQALAATGGIGTAWTNVQTAVTKGVANVIEAFDQAAQAAGLPGIAEGLDMAKQAMNTFFNVLADIVGKITSVVAPVFKFLGDHIEAVGTAAGIAAAGFTAFKIINTAKGWVDKFSDATKDAVKKLDAYKSAIDKYGSKSKAVEAVEKSRAAATKLTAEADKKAKAATEAAKRAEELREKASKAEEKALKSGATAAQAKAAADKMQQKAAQASAGAEKMAEAAEEARTKATQASTTATLQEEGVEAASNTQISLKTVLLGVLSGEYTVAEAGQLALNAAMEANPIGMVMMAITGLIAGLNLLGGALSDVTEEQREVWDAQNQYADSCKESANSVKRSMDESLAQVDVVKDQTAVTRNLLGEIDSLSKIENRNTAQKKRLNMLTQQLNSLTGETIAHYDEETDALRETTEEMAAKAKAILDLKEAEAVQQGYNDAIQEETNLRAQQKGLSKQLEEQKQKLSELQESQAQHTGTVAMDTEAIKLQKEAIENTEEALEANNTALQEAGEYRKAYGEMVDEVAKKEEAAAEQTAQSLADAIVEKHAALQQGLSDHSVTLDQLSGKNQEIVGQLQETWQGYVDKATDMFNTLSDEQTMSVDEMIANMQKNQEVITGWGDNMSALRDRFAQLGLDDAVLEQFQRMGPEGAGYVAALATASDEQLGALSTTFANGGTVAMNSLGDSLGSGAAANLEQVQHLVTDVEQSLSEQVANAHWDEMGKEVVQGLAEGLGANEEAVAKAKELAKKTSDGSKIEFEIGSPSRKYKQFGQWINEGLAQGLSTSASKAVNASKTAAQQVVSATRAAFVVMQSIGAYAMQGLAIGLNSMSGLVMSTARSIANSAAATISSALKIGSPSRLLKQYGAWAGEGLALGLASANRMVENASEALADAAAGVSFKNFGSETRYSFEGSLAFAGGDFFEVDSLRAEIADLKEAIIGRPIEFSANLDIDGRTFAKVCTPYITAEQENRNKTRNYLKGVR